MNSIFCSKCGTKVFFSGTKPEKCSGCGRLFSEESSNAKTTPRPAQKQLPRDPNHIDVSELTDIHISADIDSVKPMTLKDHWIAASPDEEAIMRDAPALPSEASILQDSVQECQPTQRSKDVGE